MKSATTIFELAEIAAEIFDTTAYDVIGPARFAYMVLPRHAIFAALYRNGVRRGRIAKIMNRDHTTVDEGIKRLEALEARDPALRDKIATITTAAKPLAVAVMASARARARTSAIKNLERGRLLRRAQRQLDQEGRLGLQAV